MESLVPLLSDVLFPPADYRRTTRSTLAWWEKRRGTYNLLVGITGLCTLAAIGILSWLPPALPHHSPPLAFIAAYALAANVCYTFGSGIELALRRIMGQRAPAIGPALFRQGVAFSMGLTLLPTIVFAFSWAARVAVHLFRLG
jgi:hypothetical protein